MSIFAIADLHLSGHRPKPMDVFGRKWANHWEKVQTAWRERVGPEDTVLIPGDISWAMTLEEAKVDLQAIAALPGQKVLLRGNHDYWWSSANRVRQHLPPGMALIQNDSMTIGSAVVCGTRGWTCPGSSSWEGAADERIYQREIIRLGLTLEAASRLNGQRLIVMLHYPPFNERQETSGFTELVERYGVHHVLYGHLHNVAPSTAFEGERNGIQYNLVACDYLDFVPRLVYEEPAAPVEGSVQA